MAYDRYIAICNPLRYDAIMNCRAWFELAAIAWISGLIHSALHTGSNIVDQFFCEIPKLRQIFYSDPQLVELKLPAVALIVTFGCFLFIIVSYVEIFMSVLRMRSVQGRPKAFLTFLPHLTVVFLFIVMGVAEYVTAAPNLSSALDLVFTVMYAGVPPLMNPLIYSMRNKELTLALWNMISLKYTPKFSFFRFVP